MTTGLQTQKRCDGERQALLVEKGEEKPNMKAGIYPSPPAAHIWVDELTAVIVLSACAKLGDLTLCRRIQRIGAERGIQRGMLELGKWVHAYVDRNHIKADGFIGNALVDMYTKCGSIDEASNVFNGMICRDVYTYTTIIVGLAMHGQGERALDIFSQIPKMGIKPNGVTYLGVLMACSHAGLVDEGRKHFSEMSRVYNLEPQMEHYGCMVDLLGLAGLVNEAQEFISNMPIEPDAFVWRALLGACRIHGNVELGEIIMEKLENLEFERDGTYVFMSNIYFSANKRRNALKLRKAMKKGQ
ncbi:hypothetical protein RHMOL_Rhmol01G0210700 [Rhododendron molle]|uniref:Uncharacterized protein n=1 Tax=Rhododendron molle TaxID=49168 RepID=A0ACC0Q5U5_RHOML|nr:hypothetical protein RHMOL_Rhmol01G0210700 [Rhododendron molle]